MGRTYPWTPPPNWKRCSSCKDYVPNTEFLVKNNGDGITLYKTCVYCVYRNRQRYYIARDKLKKTRTAKITITNSIKQ